MDLTYPPEAEEFRTEIRGWLEEHLPEGWFDEGFELSGPTVSHHLKVLRQTGLIEGDRRGTWIYYRAVPQMMEAASAALMPVTIPS